MKRTNLTIIATIIATFVISMIAFQPTATEASNNVLPAATPSPRKIRKIPAPTPSPITRSRTRKSNIRDAEWADPTREGRSKRRSTNSIYSNNMGQGVIKSGTRKNKQSIGKRKAKN